MNNLIEKFRNNIITLKELDDRINTENNINISEVEGSYVERWEYLYTMYNNLFQNLKSDVDILNNVNY